MLGLKCSEPISMFKTTQLIQKLQTSMSQELCQKPLTQSIQTRYTLQGGQTGDRHGLTQTGNIQEHKGR